jgi:hypothetical protein
MNTIWVLVAGSSEAKAYAVAGEDQELEDIQRMTSTPTY